MREAGDDQEVGAESRASRGLDIRIVVNELRRPQHRPGAVVEADEAAVIDGPAPGHGDSSAGSHGEALGLRGRALETIMGGKDDRARLGREVIDFGWSLRTDAVPA